MDVPLSSPLPLHYHVRHCPRVDRRLVRPWLHLAYQERSPVQAADCITETLEQLWTARSQAWFVDFHPLDTQPTPCGCLWLGFALHPDRGDRIPHIFLLYVSPAHRRQGLGRALMGYAETWAMAQGYPHMGLQVFLDNTAAVTLYQTQGYTPQALFCCKTLTSP